MYKATSSSLPKPIVGQQASLPPLPGFLQRPLLSKDLQLREHAEARTLRGGRAAGGTTSTPVTSPSSASPSLPSVRRRAFGALPPWRRCTSTLEEVHLPPWRRCFHLGGGTSTLEEVHFYLGGGGAVGLRVNLPHTRTHPVVLDCEPKEDQRKHINCDEVARKGKKHPVICKPAVALSLS